MGTQGRTPITLIAGIAVGLLIGGYVHTANAQQSTAPCVRPTPTAATPTGHVVFAATGGGKGSEKTDTTSFKATGPFTISYAATTAAGQFGIVVGILFNADHTRFDDVFQAAPGLHGTTSGFTRETTVNCAGGCYFTMQSNNAKWTVRVTE